MHKATPPIMFGDDEINFDILKQRANNLRWANVPEGVIPLTAADPDFPCAPQISEAIARFASERYWSYGSAEGMPQFKESMAAYYHRVRHINAKPEWILPVDSAAYGIYITCKASLKPGDEAIIFDPVDFLFRHSIEAVGAVVVPFQIPPGSDQISFEGLKGMITKKTKLICLCNPLNPTGKVFTREELVQLGDIAIENDLMILSDEIWSDIVFEPHLYTSIASLGEELNQRCITVTGFSKSYGLAGLRIGSVMTGNQLHFDQILQASGHLTTVHGSNLISQVAATAALNEAGDWLKAFLTHLTEVKNFIVKELNEVNGFHCIAPEGCYVAFTDITRTGKSSSELHEILLSQAKVAVVPGLKQWFGDGATGYIRMSFATSNEVVGDAMNRIKKVLN